MSSCHVQTVEDMRNFSDDLLRRVLKYCGSEKPLYCGLSRTTDHFLQAFEDFLFGTQALNDVLTLTFSWTLVKSGTAHIVVAFAGFMWILVTLILACARPVRHRPRTSPFWREPRAKTSFFRQRLIMLTYCSVILVVVGCVGAAIASVTANAGSLQCCSVGGEWEAVVGDDEGWQGFLNTDVNIRDMQTSYSGSAEDASVIKTLVDTGWAALVEIQGQLLCDSHLLSGFSSFIQLLDRATSLNRLVRLAALATVYILVVAVHLPLLCMACAKKEVSPSRFACLSRLMLSLEILVGLAGGLLLVSFVSHAFVVGWVSVIGDAADQPSLFRQLPAVPQYLADVVPNKVDQERFINTCVGGSGRLIDSMGLQLSDTPDNDRWLAEFDEALDCNDVVGAWLRPLSKFKENQFWRSVLGVSCLELGLCLLALVGQFILWGEYHYWRDCKIGNRKEIQIRADMFRTVTPETAVIAAANLRNADSIKNIKDSGGNTPLHYAAYQNDVECASTLLKHGFRPNQLSNFGFTPLHVAAYEGRPKIVQFLVENGGDASVIDSNGNSVITGCIENGQHQIVRLFAELGVDIFRCNTRDGASPVDVAADCGDHELAAFLQRIGPYRSPQRRWSIHE